MLFETAAGYAIFKARPATVVVKRSRVSNIILFLDFLLSVQLLDEEKLQSIDGLYRQFEDAESASKL